MFTINIRALTAGELQRQLEDACAALEEFLASNHSSARNNSFNTAAKQLITVVNIMQTRSIDNDSLQALKNIIETTKNLADNPGSLQNDPFADAKKFFMSKNENRYLLGLSALIVLILSICTILIMLIASMFPKDTADLTSSNEDYSLATQFFIFMGYFSVWLIALASAFFGYCLLKAFCMLSNPPIVLAADNITETIKEINNPSALPSFNLHAVHSDLVGVDKEEVSLEAWVDFTEEDGNQRCFIFL